MSARTRSGAVKIVDRRHSRGRRASRARRPTKRAATLARTAGLRDRAASASADSTSRGTAQRIACDRRVTAAVGQTCVVTLEPIENEISESVDLVFRASSGGKSIAGRAGRGDHAIQRCRAAGAVRGGSVDLGAVATEFLLLGIDPYPRAGTTPCSRPTPAGDAEEPSVRGAGGAEKARKTRPVDPVR